MTTMENLPEVVSREEWLAARKELLVKEKELTRVRDREQGRGTGAGRPALNIERIYSTSVRRSLRHRSTAPVGTAR